MISGVSTTALYTVGPVPSPSQRDWAWSREASGNEEEEERLCIHRVDDRVSQFRAQR